MTLQRQDILLLEEMIERIVRKVVQEEMSKRDEPSTLSVSEEDKKLANDIMGEYDDVFKALA